MTNERIAIIGGTGDQGKGLAYRWATAGYEIVIGSRDPGRAEAAAADLRNQLGVEATRVTGLGNSEAARSAAMVVLTVPFAAQIATMNEISGGLAAGTLLIDVTVPLEPAVGGRPSRILGVWAGSAAEQCAELAPAGVDVASGFHNVSASLLCDVSRQVDCDVLVCSDSKQHRERVRPLVEAIPGCRYVDAGLLSNSRTVEALTALLIGINQRYKAHTGLRITGF